MAPAGAAYYRLALVLGALSAMGPLAIDMYLPALPAIARDLGASSGAVQFSLAAYFVGIALGQAFYGPLSDRVGRKPALYSGLVVFALASVGCALAPDIEILVVCRFLQALGGCAPLVIPRAIVRDHFDERGSVRMLSTLILVMGAAPILAPLLGGQMLTAFGWRSVFWLLTAYGAVWLVLSMVLLPESLPPARRRRESFSAVLAVYAGLLRDRTYLSYVVVGGLVFSGMLAYITSSAFVFIELFHIPPEQFGLFFGTNAFGLIAASQINGWLAVRMDPRRILGLVLPVSVGSGVTLLVDAATGFGGFAGIMAPLFLYIATHGFVMPNTTALAMAPHGRVAGSASALLGTIQFVLGATAGAVVGVLANGTAVPLAVVVAGCGVAAWSVYQTLP